MVPPVIDEDVRDEKNAVAAFNRVEKKLEEVLFVNVALVEAKVEIVLDANVGVSVNV
jgi:hypothetical protein